MKSKVLFLGMILLLVLQPLRAAGHDGVVAQADTSVIKTLFNSSMFRHNSSDSLVRARHKKTFFHQVGKVFTRFFREFDMTDTNYVEPQHFNYTVMLQNTNTYEEYTLYDKEGQSITFAPDVSYRLGPYLGWRWLFLGYTLDIKHINASSSHTNKKEFDLSLYSSMLGIDLFWRQTGNDYHIQRMKLGEHVNASPMRKQAFDGFKSSIKGFNLYYIFNHRKFSYPAAYSQSTVQRRSVGSMLLGIGYTQHELEVDWDKLTDLVDSKLNQDKREEDKVRIDSSLMFSKVRYSDYSATIGYAYNWVFAKNWLFNASASVGVAYNQSHSDTEEDTFNVKNFRFRNFNFDGVGRFGLVWNNTRWYAGASAIIHSYNYKKNKFSTNNSFGSLNLYVGVNFGRKRNH